MSDSDKFEEAISRLRDRIDSWSYNRLDDIQEHVDRLTRERDEARAEAKRLDDFYGKTIEAERLLSGELSALRARIADLERDDAAWARAYDVKKKAILILAEKLSKYEHVGFIRPMGDALPVEPEAEGDHIPDATEKVEDAAKAMDERHERMTGHSTDKRCPRCNCTLLRNANGDEWCSFVGGRDEKPCTYGLNQPAEECLACGEIPGVYTDKLIRCNHCGRGLGQPAEEVIGESWVILGPSGTLGRTFSDTEDWCWIIYLKIDGIPYDMDDIAKGTIEKWKRDGYRAVKVKLVAVSDSGKGGMQDD